MKAAKERCSAWLMLLGAATLFLAACAGPHALTTSPAIPAAKGEIKVDDAGPNTSIRVEVEHLAAPERVQPGATTYVVWAQQIGTGAQPQSLGALALNPDLTGRLETVTALRNFELYITAEPAPTVTAPSGDRLLWTTVSR